MDSLKAKNIIITGASSGIGEALAIQAAKIGANIVIASRNISKLEELKKSILQKAFNGELKTSKISA